MAARGARAAGGDACGRLLRNSSRDDSVELLAAMRQGLKQTGYVEGKNLAIAIQTTTEMNRAASR
jgi:hypothetical protein